jgi:hypothetical protein
MTPDLMFLAGLATGVGGAVTVVACSRSCFDDRSPGADG